MIESRSVSITEEKKCTVQFCNVKCYGKGLCQRHYMQMRRHGKITEYGRSDKNEVIHENEISKIVLRDLKNEVTGTCIIDSIDYDLVKNHKWYLGNHGYTTTHIGKSLVLLHQLLNPNWKMTDHKKRNKLDNRRKSIRECNYITNGQNIRSSKGTSKFKGVCWCNQKNKWMSKICVDKSSKHLGFFKNEINAAKAYDIAAIKYFKSFANINFPEIMVVK